MALLTEKEVRRYVRIGDRENPCVVDFPGALDRAVNRVWQPTEGQASAGNYRMAHAVVGGLDMTIETPLDRVRSGVGPDGTPWSVRMPAHYGYVKRTEGADGDHVDVYVGPEAHRAAALPVWVVDQVDADTGAFDECKALVGFADGPSAGRAYLAAFSDGRGRDRAGAATRMTFAAFKRWLEGDARKPLAYARSAAFPPSSAPCGCRHSASDQTAGHRGGSMPDTVVAAAVVTPKGVGVLKALIQKAWPTMTPKDRVDLLTEAASDTTVALGKATDLLEQGDDHERPGRIEDIFDGPPDDHLETVRAHGPDSSVAPGKVNVGPSQDASGNGAARMEREYSRHAPQSGVQRATEELGRKIAGQTRAMKAFAAFGKSVVDRLDTMQAALSGAAAVPVQAIDKAAVDAAVAAAVAKALPAALAGALAQAVPAAVKAAVKAKKGDSETESESDKDSESGEEDEEEDEDDEAGEEESGSGTEIEIVNENEAEDEAESDEDEGKKAMRKAAARERRIAKGLVRLAKKAAQAADDSAADGRFAGAARLHKCVRSRLAKARLHVELAKSMRPGRAAPVVAAIEKSIVAVAKAMKDTRAKNQDKWPASTAKPLEGAKGPTEIAAAAAKPGADLTKAVTEMTAAVEKANAGYALMTGTVQSLLATVGGQSRDPVNATSPVTELFKAATDKRTRINAAYGSGEITAAERDKGIDALVFTEMPSMPATTVELAIAGCPPAVQAILRAAA